MGYLHSQLRCFNSFPFPRLSSVSTDSYAVPCLYSAVRKLDRHTLQMSDQPPAFFGQLSGIVYCKNNASATCTFTQTLRVSFHS